MYENVNVNKPLLFSKHLQLLKCPGHILFLTDSFHALLLYLSPIWLYVLWGTSCFKKMPHGDNKDLQTLTEYITASIIYPTFI